MFIKSVLLWITLLSPVPFIRLFGIKNDGILVSSDHFRFLYFFIHLKISTKKSVDIRQLTSGWKDGRLLGCVISDDM